MLKAIFLWSQLMAGISLAAENLYHFKLSRGNRSGRDWWGLAVAFSLTGIATVELFFIAYRWLPAVALFPTLLALDVLAAILYLRRVEPFKERLEAGAQPMSEMAVSGEGRDGQKSRIPRPNSG